MTSSRPLTVLFAPDSFKGSLTSVQVARALADGWSAGTPDRPGSSTHRSVTAGRGRSTRSRSRADGSGSRPTVTGPLGLAVNAGWLRSDDGQRGVRRDGRGVGAVAGPAGRARSRPGDDRAGPASCSKQALDGGVRRIILGIGGSATTDGGRGILEALGARDDGTDVDLRGLDPRLAEVDLEIACDVEQPAPRTARSGRDLRAAEGRDRRADRGARHATRELGRRASSAATGRRERETPGAGAAGGIGFGLLAIADRFRSFALRPGHRSRHGGDRLRRRSSPTPTS